MHEAFGILRTVVDRVMYGGLNPNQPFRYYAYDEPLTDALYRGLPIEERANENAESTHHAVVDRGLVPTTEGLNKGYDKPNLSGLSAQRAIDELFEWHTDNIHLLNLTRQVGDRSLFDLHLTALFRNAEELYREHFVSLPPLEIGTADIDYLNANACLSSNGAIVVLNHGIAALPFWLAALHRLPRPWNEIDPDQCKALVDFAGVTEYVMRRVRGPGLDEIIAELSETVELEQFSTGYGGWYGNVDGSGVLWPQNQMEHYAPHPGGYIRSILETFIVCHELAHVALDHLNRKATWGNWNSWSKRQRLLRHAELHQMEIQADALAIEMTRSLRLASYHTYLWPGRIFAPMTLLEALVSFYLLLACSEPRFRSVREINERTHPAAITRLKCGIYHFAKWFWAEQEEHQKSLMAALEAWQRDLLVLPELVRAARRS